MESNLQHEDLLIKLRAKLNDEKIKLWESPYIMPDNSISDSLKNLAKKFASELSVQDEDAVLEALHELQLHSIERSKANSEFKETGIATLRVKATIPGQKPQILKVQMPLTSPGDDLFASVGNDLNVAQSRIKIIFNGKVIKPGQSLEEQGIKNGSQIMVLIMAVNPEQVKKEDNMYMEMKTTREDAELLSEYIDDFDDEYIKLEDQSGKTVELPAAERRALMIGLALHERGRAAVKAKDYPLALVLLLEADRQLSECSSSILQSVDNVAVLQLDVAWCYLCLQSLSAASDAAARLARAEASLKQSYGEDHRRLVALKGTDANERVLMMRLHLLQGIVSFHQNRREEARRLLEKAESELNMLRVDESAVVSLVELGWSAALARVGLRAARGDVTRAHHYLAAHAQAQRDARAAHRDTREKRALGICMDGSPVNKQFVEALYDMGYSRRLATLALRNSNNHVAEAVRLIQEQPEMLQDSDLSSDETESPSSEESVVEADNKLVGELEAMGYVAEDARTALRMARNHISGAVDLLVAGGGHVQDTVDGANSNPSTSADVETKRKKKERKHNKPSKKQQREEALNRLSSAIKSDADDHLDTSLVEEEEFLVQYKSLL